MSIRLPLYTSVSLSLCLSICLSISFFHTRRKNVRLAQALALLYFQASAHLATFYITGSTMQLLSEEQERYAEVQEWASDIFAAPSKKRARKTVELQKHSIVASEDEWPSPDLATAVLAQILDSGHLRAQVLETL